MEGIPEIPNQIAERLTQYQNTRSAGLQGWDRRGEGLFIATRFSETAQIHYLNKAGGARQQITFYKEPIGGIATNPMQEGFLFAKDIGGNEFYQIYYHDLSTGTARMLTDGKSRNGGFSWSNMGDKYVFTSTKRNGTDTDIYLSDLGKQHTEAQILVEKGGSWGVADWARDDTRLLVLQYVSANESYPYILDIATKTLTPIFKANSKNKVSYGSMVFNADGKGIFITSDEGGEFQQLYYYDIATQKSTLITKDINWDIDGMQISADRSQIAFTSNEGGVNKLYLLDTKTQQYKPINDIPIGVIGGLEFHPEGKKLAIAINTPKNPTDVFVVQLDNSQIERWTFSEVGGLNTTNFVVPTLIQFPTFDKVDGKARQIPAFYYKPTKTKFEKIPVLIHIHGGPEGQSLPTFNAFYQYMLNEMGIAVIDPNVRGSAGYGKTYLGLDNGFKREESVQDIGALLDWIAQQPELDASRVAVYGGSYGGYMTLASMTHFNDRLKCGIDVVGISNFVTFLNNTQDYRRDLRRVEYGDEREPKMKEFMEKIAPLNNAQKITKPMFIIQGLNDPRVPASEAEQMVKKIRANGGKVWYLLAKDEGHGFRKKVNIDYYQNSIVLFLEENLLK
ncbi:MAG: S9 family peptidase [Cytophagales bacterium]|nr:MAG: S9 family peptidase [Cytophagales bacterium]